MKNLLTIIFILISSLALAEKHDDGRAKTSVSTIENIADNTLRQFSYFFYKATDVKWVSNGNLQKAIFKLDGKESYALYNNQSSFLVATQKAATTELPSKARDYINSNYAEYLVNSAVKVIARPVDYQFADDTNSFWVSLLSHNKQVILLVRPDGSTTVVSNKKISS